MCVNSNIETLAGIEPPRMDWSAAELPVEFANFRQYCDLIFGGPLADIAEPEKFTYVLLWVAKERLRINNNTWELTPTEVLNRFNLQRYRQETSESEDEFTPRCKLQAKKCQFRDARGTDECFIE